MSRLDISIQQEPFWAMSVGDALASLQTGAEGLRSSEAKKRLLIFGENKLADGQGLDALKILLAQFKSPLILILVAAAAITLSLTEWLDAGVLIATIAINAGLGFWQEYKAENVLEKLKSYIKIKAHVRRDEREMEIDSIALVPGDVIRLEAGHRAPADCRLLAADDLQIDESVLTGESLPDEKSVNKIGRDAALHERTCMVWSGTLIVQGSAEAVVTATNAWTEFGRIASAIARREREESPLQKAVAVFAKKTSVILGLLVAAFFAIGLLSGQKPYDMFFIAVAVLVSAVPEGLPVSLTAILAVGVERLAAKGGVVRRLLSAETLGSTTLILTDKTGTLTTAKMRLADVVPASATVDELLTNALLTTDVILENPKDKPEKWRLSGRALEVALTRDAYGFGVRPPTTREVVERLPFDSKRKYSAALIQTPTARRLVSLGAPEIILEICDLPENEKNRLLFEIGRRAESGERLLGVSTAEAPQGFSFKKKELTGMRFLGLLAFRDPLRPGVAETIRRIAQEGVATVIVTGDHPGTAGHVATELGIMTPGEPVATGKDLDAWSRQELLARLPKIRVWSRVTPEHKLMLTKLYKERGEVVAVTGDGLNDAPALRAADVGVAVGSGTDVAKSVSDLILLNDDFSTLALAVEEGRRILQNIRKAIAYLLSDALDELFLIGGALTFGLAMPLSAVQILYVNFFSDSLPAIAFAFERGAPGDIAKPTHAKHLLDRETRSLIFAVGASSSLLLFALYFTLLRLGYEPSLVRSFIFAAFGTYTLFVSLSLRSLRKPLWTYGPFGNKPLAAGVAIGLLLMVGAIYLPSMNMLLGTVPLAWPWALGVVIIGMINIALVEGTKFLFRKVG